MPKGFKGFQKKARDVGLEMAHVLVAFATPCREAKCKAKRRRSDVDPLGVRHLRVLLLHLCVRRRRPSPCPRRGASPGRRAAKWESAEMSTSGQKAKPRSFTRIETLASSVPAHPDVDPARAMLRSGVRE